ncbi:MAG: TolC family protein [Gemmatimonadota bacterium]|nr:TolC family protein [Gemmatimonadota bacterium]
MRTSIWMCALVCLAGRASAQQRTPVGGSDPVDTLRLTRRQAVAMALEPNPAIDVVRQQTAQVKAQRWEGMSIPDPTLSAGYDSLPSLTGFSPTVSKPVSLSLTIPFPDKLHLAERVGAYNVRASQQQLALVQQGIAASTSEAYDAVLVAHLHRRDFVAADSLAGAFLQRTEARFNAGTVPRLDVIKAQVDFASARNDLIANSRDVANAESALNRLIGRPLGAPLALADSLAVPAPLPALDAVEQTALLRRPEILSLDAQLRAARTNSRLVREQAFLPDLFVGASRDASVSDPTWYSVGIAMPIPIFFWQHAKGDFAETQHRELELAATIRDTRAAVGQDVRSAWATADAAQRQAVFIRDQLLPSAREGYRAAAAAYAAGGLSALDVIDARRSLLDAEGQYADALAAANSARSDLERAAGVPLTSIPTGAPRE